MGRTPVQCVLLTGSDSGSHVPSFTVLTGWETLDSQITCKFPLTFLYVPLVCFLGHGHFTIHRRTKNRAMKVKEFEVLCLLKKSPGCDSDKISCCKLVDWNSSTVSKRQQEFKKRRNSCLIFIIQLPFTEASVNASQCPGCFLCHLSNSHHHPEREVVLSPLSGKEIRLRGIK